jgi:alpha-N-acetylglucosaminidase
LQPDDHLFVEIGRKFVLEMIETFNYTAHVYNVNTYNELAAPTSRTVLAEAAKAVQKGLQTGDPEAIWLMNDWGVKNWPFLNAKAYITAIPKDRRIILDQEGTNYARFQRFKSYFGYPFIYGMIHDFGGQNSMFGFLFKLNRKVIDAFNNKKTAYSLIGTGINPEGINQNEIQYELMNEFAWKTEEVNLAVWTQNFYQRRYGIQDPADDQSSSYGNTCETLKVLTEYYYYYYYY